MDYDTNPFFVKTFFLLLVLGLPPLTIGSGKVIRSLKGWQWTALPVIVYITISYVVFTAVGVRVTLTDLYKWDESWANDIGVAAKILGLMCCAYGVFSSPGTKPIEASESE